jgi:hypothetical protein
LLGMECGKNLRWARPLSSLRAWEGRKGPRDGPLPLFRAARGSDKRPTEGTDSRSYSCEGEVAHAA